MNRRAFFACLVAAPLSPVSESGGLAGFMESRRGAGFKYRVRDWPAGEWRALGPVVYPFADHVEKLS